MSRCRICPSYAINPSHHGRDEADQDLCDVCYWRTRAPQWQPIQTAPKDGTVWAFNGEQGVMAWSEGDGWALWVWADALLSDVDPAPAQPTHWQPLPAPPEV